MSSIDSVPPNRPSDTQGTGRIGAVGPAASAVQAGGQAVETR
jgi:hypothetical protein